MQILKEIWHYLNNKKSQIGAVANVLAMWVFAKGWLDETDMFMLAGLLTLWTGVAVGHHIQKGLK
jgi:hypothetical protein